MPVQQLALCNGCDAEIPWLPRFRRWKITSDEMSRNGYDETPNGW